MNKTIMLSHTGPMSMASPVLIRPGCAQGGSKGQLPKQLLSRTFLEILRPVQILQIDWQNPCFWFLVQPTFSLALLTKTMYILEKKMLICLYCCKIH